MRILITGGTGFIGISLVKKLTNSKHEILVLTRQKKKRFHNDPTAGSPTVTLLRLLLPLNDQV